MSRRRRTATPTFQRPLTTMEVTGERIYHPLTYLKCHKCGMFGQTLVEINDQYECQDKARCALWQTGAKALDKTRKVVV